MKKIITAIILIMFGGVFTANAQDITALVNHVRDKLARVNDYVAHGTLKTDVTFIKAPVGKVTVYYSKPDHFKLEKEKGISILPKGGLSVHVGSLLETSSYVVVPAGNETINGVQTTVVKLVPIADTGDIILSTLYIDPVEMLVMKAVTTTRDNGTYEVTMTYGKYRSYGLPDKAVFSFNTKDYRLPRGVTLEFDENTPSDTQPLKNRKGKIEITYTSYNINTGMGSRVFQPSGR